MLRRVSVALLLTACNHSPKASGIDAGVASAVAPSAAASSSGPEAVASAPGAPAAVGGCRALAAQGDVKLVPGNSKVGLGTAVDGKVWLELAPGSSVSFRHSTTARELTLKGPGRALVCMDGGEDVVLADGSVETATGPGARPGAEVTIATPFGSVSYGDAKLSIKVSAKRLEASAGQGEGWLEPAQGAVVKGPQKISASSGKATLSGPAEPGPLVESCERVSAETERLAKSVLGGPEAAGAGADGGSLGDRAAAHVRARRSARSACRSALAAVARLADEAKRRELEERLGRAEKQWSGIPKTH